MERRAWLKAAVALAGTGLPLAGALRAAAAAPRTIGDSRPFDYAWLKARARSLAAAAYQPPAARLPLEVAKLDWDAYQAIRNREGRDLWSGAGARFRANVFHLGLFFKAPVHLHEVANG